MELSQALKALIGAPMLIAFRQGGPILKMTDRQLVLDVRSGRPSRWSGKFSDYVAIDWQVMTQEQFAEMLRQAQIAREAG